MIIFNDVALEDIAPVKVEDIRISPIALAPTARQRSTGEGQVFVRMRDTSRTVAITFALLRETMYERQAILDIIAAWAHSDAVGRLQLPCHDGVYLEAICTALPEPSMRQWWESKLRLTFTTMENPYWTSGYEKSAPCGEAFTVTGSAPPLMRIERTLSEAAADQTYALDGKSMTFSTIPAGKLVLDLNHQTAAVDGESVMSGYTMTSTFLKPRAGKQTIEGAGTVYWRERWV